MENRSIFLYRRNLNLSDAEVKGKPPDGLGGLKSIVMGNHGELERDGASL